MVKLDHLYAGRLQSLDRPVCSFFENGTERSAAMRQAVLPLAFDASTAGPGALNFAGIWRAASSLASAVVRPEMLTAPELSFETLHRHRARQPTPMPIAQPPRRANLQCEAMFTG